MELNGVKVTFNPSKFDYDILHINFCGINSYRYVKLAKKRGIKVVIHAHTTAEDLKNSFIFSNLFSYPLKFWLKMFYANADLLIAPSQYTKNILETRYGLRDIVVVSNGVDINKFRQDSIKGDEFRKKYGIKKKQPLIFSVGLVFKRKGIIDFIDVSRCFGEPFLWIGKHMGFIVEDIKLKKSINTAPKNFLLTGYVKDIISAYSAGDIFFFPSYEENQGIVVLEAASMAKPIVVRDIPVYEGWLYHNKNCFKAKSNEEFRRYIDLLLKNKAIRERLSRNAFKLSKKHSLEKTGAELKKNYEDILRNVK